MEGSQWKQSSENSFYWNTAIVYLERRKREIEWCASRFGSNVKTFAKFSLLNKSLFTVYQYFLIHFYYHILSITSALNHSHISLSFGHFSPFRSEQFLISTTKQKKLVHKSPDSGPLENFLPLKFTFLIVLWAGVSEY